MVRISLSINFKKSFLFEEQYENLYKVVDIAQIINKLHAKCKLYMNTEMTNNDQSFGKAG